MKARWTLLLVATGVLASCAAPRRPSADEYFRQAIQSFRTGALVPAIDQFHELLDQYPFSQYNEEAELKIAQAHYLAGSYPEAIVALTDFQRRHPTSVYLPFIGYYLGMCYAQQMGTIDRDQTAAQNGQNYFETVAQQYPDSPFSELAREQLAFCRENLARHELYVARFYITYRNKKAAEIRLLTLASRYGDTDAAADGLLQLARLYQKRKQDEDAVLAYQALEQLHPHTPQAVAARDALGQLASVDPPPAANPLDVLLAANGRRRTSGSFTTVQVPGLEPAHVARGPATAAAPGFAPTFSPFGGPGARPY
ncbi:MAG: outer membrane protein assembly factor BamD [Candidatus Binatia bacterium]